MTVAYYHEVIMKHGLVTAQEPVPDDLVAVLGFGEFEYEKILRAQTLGQTWRSFERTPYDYGIVAINLGHKTAAHVYGWTFGRNFRVQGRDEERLGPPVWDLDYTDHTLSIVIYDEDVQRWRLAGHSSAFDAPSVGKELGRGDVLLQDRHSFFLPYYELNSVARRLLGVTEFEDWAEQRDE